MGEIQASLADARKALPTETDVPSFTRQVVSDGARAGVSVVSVTAATPVQFGVAAAAAKQANPSGQLYAVPVTLTVKGSAANELKFITSLRSAGKRAALITSTQLGADASGKVGALQLTVQVQLFVAPQSPAQQAALDKLLASAAPK
jgi:hypothetical protein